MAELSDSRFFSNLEKKNIELRSDSEKGRVSICILKGRTTTQEQFERFLRSIGTSIDYFSEYGDPTSSPLFELFFMIDTPEAISALRKFTIGHKSSSFLFYCLKRNSDAGDLRNEFMATLEQLDIDLALPVGSSFFGFMDGDDQVNPEYFTSLSESTMLMRSTSRNAKLIIINPASVYSDDGLTDRYPLKWVFNARNAKKEGKSLTDLALEDVIGGQAWGKFYSSYSILRSGAKFGKGLYEDVPFWYQVCSCIDNWDDILLSPDTVYYWRRDNNLSLTRVTPDWGSFCHAFDNLEKACDIAVERLRVKPSDVRVWKRYTTGILNLLRNAEKVEDEGDRKMFIQKITSRINTMYFNLRGLEVEEPDYIRRVKETCPDYEQVLSPYM